MTYQISNYYSDMSSFLDGDKKQTFVYLEEAIQQCINDLDDVCDTVETTDLELSDSAQAIVFQNKTVDEIQNILHENYCENINICKIKFKNASKTEINKAKSKLETNLELLRKIKRALC